MLYCENCNRLTEGKICQYCGNKKLRDVTDDDFCYFTKMDTYDFEMIEYTLNDNGIDVIGVPFYPYGVSYASAGRAHGRKVYVRHKDLEKAKNIFQTIFGSNES
ncbi:MAG: hypothetical protein ACI4MN_06395 [Candidatus Coproplasma sp.]